jgi:hypothetical protein
VGVYPNTAQFKLALSQHAIKNEFEFNIEKSDPERLRVTIPRRKTSVDGLRAFIYRDGITIKVIGCHSDSFVC